MFSGHLAKFEAVEDDNGRNVDIAKAFLEDYRHFCDGDGGDIVDAVAGFVFE